MDIEEQYDKIYHYCYFKLHDRQSAQDITQETFLRFFRQDLSLDSSQELPYLYTIAKNLCTDNFRKKTAERFEAVAEAAAYNPTGDWINNLALKSVISRLPQEEQELIFLRYVNEIGVAAICRITGLSRFAVYRRLSKALKQLKKELQKEGFLDE